MFAGDQKQHQQWHQLKERQCSYNYISGHHRNTIYSHRTIIYWAKSTFLCYFPESKHTPLLCIYLLQKLCMIKEFQFGERAVTLARSDTSYECINPRYPQKLNLFTVIASHMRNPFLISTFSYCLTFSRRARETTTIPT